MTVTNYDSIYDSIVLIAVFKTSVEKYENFSSRIGSNFLMAIFFPVSRVVFPKAKFSGLEN